MLMKYIKIWPFFSTEANGSFDKKIQNLIDFSHSIVYFFNEEAPFFLP